MSSPKYAEYIPAQTPSTASAQQQTATATVTAPTAHATLSTFKPQSPAIDIRKWGPATWAFLHTYSFAYPEQPSDADKQHALSLLHTVQRSLPCHECRNHFSKTLTEFQPNLESRDAFSRWLVDVHNRVNVRLGKPEKRYEDVRTWQHARGTLCDAQAGSDTAMYIVLCSIAAAIVGVLVGIAIGASKRRKPVRTTKT
jgi:hypothetical protein